MTFIAASVNRRIMETSLWTYEMDRFLKKNPSQQNIHISSINKIVSNCFPFLKQTIRR